MTPAHDPETQFSPAHKTSDSDPVLKLALNAVEELKAESVEVLDISAMTTIAEHMIICTGRSDRHVKSISETLMTHAKEAGMAPRAEGLEQAEWVLIDLNGVIVHIMQPAARAYYQIEKLWDVDLTAPNSSSATH